LSTPVDSPFEITDFSTEHRFTVFFDFLFPLFSLSLSLSSCTFTSLNRGGHQRGFESPHAKLVVGIAFVANRSLVFLLFLSSFSSSSSSSSLHRRLDRLDRRSRGIFPPLDHPGDSRGRRSSRPDRIVQ